MNRIARTWQSALAAVLLPTAALAAATPAHADVTVTTSAVFNDPDGTAAEQNRIRDHLVSLIDATPAGEQITASVYTFTDSVAATALVAAKQRGVKVRLIVDDTTVTMSGGQYPALAAGLGTDRGQDSWVTACPAGRGCIGSRVVSGDDPAINHNKFWLFSKVGGASDVVVQTSANLTTAQRTGYFNNAVTIPDPGLYAIYQAYFADLLHYGTATAGLSDYYKTPTSTTGPYKAYFFPRHEAAGTAWNADPSTDTVKLILDNVSCAGGTRIRVGINLFSREEVARKLVSLAGSGCSVYLAADGAPGSMSAGVTDIVSGRLTKRVECYENGADGTRKGLHSKYLLIEGTYDGAADRKLVWTGSHNYTYSALRANDETLLKIDNAAVYDQFKANHDRLMAYCAGS
ncbi:phospholipase D-like domain-containing protein [Kitasatospora cinereorecta]|uniref:phospholipase D n=1 Tax=Kitasatospora cinereorecta TaxID=285560 RepID=A0ABW0VG04_9ACTN